MGKLFKRLGIGIGATILSAMAAELIYRAAKPAPYEDPKILWPDGTEIPLAAIIGMLRESGEDGERAARPESAIKGNLEMRHWYDRPTWDYFDEDGCVDVRTNSLGFRDLEFGVEKPDGELRVMAVGDSFTFGNGVRLEDSWPQILEALLREQRGGEPTEVINAGYATGSFWPPGYVAWIESDGVAFDPDIVILGLCLNDLSTDVPMLYPVPAPGPWLGGISELLNRVQLGWETRRILSLRWDFAALIEHVPEPWEETKAACRRIRDILAGRDIEFVIATFPMLCQLGDYYPYQGLHDLVSEFCAAEAIDNVDLLPEFRHRNELDLWVHPTDQHPNDAGHRLIAKGLLEHLARR